MITVSISKTSKNFGLEDGWKGLGGVSCHWVLWKGLVGVAVKGVVRGLVLGGVGVGGVERSVGGLGWYWKGWKRLDGEILINWPFHVVSRNTILLHH